MLEDILNRIYTIEHIPTIPTVKEAINSIVTGKIEKEETYIKLAEFLAFDPSLTIEFLKIANSNSFGFKN